MTTTPKGKAHRHRLGSYHDRQVNKNKARHQQKTAKSTLTATEYHARYILGGNASHARFMHYVRLAKRDANAS